MQHTNLILMHRIYETKIKSLTDQGNIPSLVMYIFQKNVLKMATAFVSILTTRNWYISFSIKIPANYKNPFNWKIYVQTLCISYD